MPTVLVVDDEPVVRDMVAMMLEGNGLSVLTAGSGPDALDVWRSQRGRIDILVSDMRMPGMDGCTLANELQAENPHLPVLLISGYCESEPIGPFGPLPLLPKPFSMSALLFAVHGLLSTSVRREPAPDLLEVISSGAGR